MYAEIKHQPDAVRTFWFVVPAKLQHDIQEGDCVEVQTKYGKRQGFVVQLSPTPGYAGCFRKVLKIYQPDAQPSMQDIRVEHLL